MISLYMFVYHMPPVVKPKKVVEIKQKKKKLLLTEQRLKKKLHGSGFIIGAFLFTSQYVCLGVIDVSSNPILKGPCIIFMQC